MPARVPIAINFGRSDKTSPKHAPFGVLKRAKNLRHREQGGLGMRHAYSALPMTSAAGTVIAYDLHEFQGRLLALGSDQDDGYPSQLFEYTNLSSAIWTDTGNSISPFTNACEVAGIPQAEGGVQHCDAASGGGYTCLVYRPVGAVSYAVVVDSRTNQTILQQRLTSVLGDVEQERVCFAGGKFFIQGVTQHSVNAIKIASFEPGEDAAFTLFATVDGSGSAVSASDLVPVSNGSSVLLASAFDRGSSADLSIVLLAADGSQVGSTITVSTTDTLDLSIDADEGDDTILLLTIENTDDVVLRTFDFDGNVVHSATTVLDGGVSCSVCRIDYSGTHFAICAINNGDGDVSIRGRNASTHTSGGLIATFPQFVLKTRVLPVPSSEHPDRIVFGGIVGFDSYTNALAFVDGSSGDNQHVMTRDYLRGVASDPTTLTLDPDTGSICWVSVHNPGVASLGVPAVTLVDFQSTERIQAVNYGGLRYFAGGTPWVYDGRVVVESGFSEAPSIKTLTASSATGSLASSATYTYAVHWEFTFADGSYLESPPSQVKSVTLGASDNRVTVVATAPHSLRIAGTRIYGMTATLVLSRTEWSATTIDVSTGTAGVQFSILRRAQQVALAKADYGDVVTIVDDLADSTLATQEPIYTQGTRGEFSCSLEHDAPEACRYITATESRLLNGGLTRPFEVQVSKEAFLGQPFAYSELSNFFQTVSAAVRGVHALDGTKLVFTQDDIYALTEGAPDDEGKGALGLPVRLPTPSGLKDWRSFLEGPDGLWCQLDDDKLFRLPRGGGSPSWEGAGIVKLLKDFPAITGTARHKGDNAGLFALVNSDGDDARIAVRDFLFESWLEDEPPLENGSGIEAMTHFGRTVAYLSGGVVYVQDGASFADNGTDFIDCQLETQPIYPFGIGGYGLIQDVLLTAEYRGACIVTLSVSYDDGLNYTALPSFTISGLTSGAAVRRKWTLPIEATESVSFKVSVATAGAPSEGLILNQLDLLVQPTDGLPDLSPSEMT